MTRRSDVKTFRSRLEHGFHAGTQRTLGGITVARASVMRATAERLQREVVVTIVATNPETLDGLQSYLRGAGVGARGTRDLAECTRSAAESEGKLAVVIFPDDFRWEKVVAALAELAALRPPVLPVLVTAHPQKFKKLRAAEDVIIMPRPVWGWTILDAIRAQTERQDPIDRGG